MQNVHLYYPPATTGRYPTDVEALVKKYAWLLFDPDRLPEVVHPNFKEYLQGDGLTLDGLPALQRYRRDLGQPILHRVNLYAVPPNRRAYRLDGSGKRFTFDAIMELIFDVREEDLPDAAREELGDLVVPGARYPVVLPMWEPTAAAPLTTDEPPVEGVPFGRWLIRSRSHWPVLERGRGRPGEQHGYVARQVRHHAETGQPFSQSGRAVPTWQLYNQIIQSDQFPSDPTANG